MCRWLILLVYSSVASQSQPSLVYTPTLASSRADFDKSNQPWLLLSSQATQQILVHVVYLGFRETGIPS
jgi:hypothetical protein